MANTQYPLKIQVTPLGKLMLEDNITRTTAEIDKLDEEIKVLLGGGNITSDNAEGTLGMIQNDEAIKSDLKRNQSKLESTLARLSEPIIVSEIGTPEIVQLGSAVEIVWGDVSHHLYDRAIFMITGLTDFKGEIRTLGAYTMVGNPHAIGTYLLSNPVKVGDLLPLSLNYDKNVPQARVERIMWGESTYSSLYKAMKECNSIKE